MRNNAAVVVVAVVVGLAGCASAPRPQRDGAEAQPPPNLADVPDATPRVEPILPRGPNKPYEMFGRSYVPLADDAPFRESGLASWYGRKFHGRPTANGETYNMYAMTAAHPTLPIPSYARVRNPKNGREVIVRINDRGPFHPGRVIDLSYTAALKLDVLRGVTPVEVERLTHDEIRSGAWRRDLVPDAPALAAAAPGAVAPRGAALGSVTPGRAAPSSAAPGSAASSSAAPGAVAPDAVPPSGTAPSGNAIAGAGTPASTGFWVQLGAFRERDGALAFHRDVAREADWLAPLLAIFEDDRVHRLQAGPYRTRDDARGAAERIRALLQLVPVIVERR
jgi:rare lipoprotein A